jgi:hypothetical protein
MQILKVYKKKKINLIYFIFTCYDTSMSYFINRKMTLSNHIIFTCKIFIPDFNLKFILEF